MPWLAPALIATFSNTAILSLVYLYLFVKEKEKSLLLFCISWSLYSLRFVFMLLYLFFELDWFLIGNQALVLISGHMLLVAVNVWLKKYASPQIWSILSFICLLWILAAGLSDILFTIYTIPVFFYVGALYIAIGVRLLKNRSYAPGGRRIVGITLIVWGIHKLDYPFLRPVEWFAPWGYLLGAVAAVVTAIGMILIYFDAAKERLNELLREKEILLREVHHRVKNNLTVLHSLLRNQIDLVLDPESQALLQKLEDKIFAFALIHNLLHKAASVERIDFFEYVKTFAHHLVDTYGEESAILEFSLETEPLVIDIDLAKNLGLILNELLTNSLKHAFRNGDQKRIRIGMQQIGEDKFIMTVEDNGIGIPEGATGGGAKMSGLYLVSVLCEEIQAELSIQSRGGTQIGVGFRLLRTAN